MDPNPDLDPTYWQPGGPVRVTKVLTNIPGLTVLSVDGVVARPGDTLAVRIIPGPDGGPTAKLVHRRPRWWALGAALPVPLPIPRPGRVLAGDGPLGRLVPVRWRRRKHAAVLEARLRVVQLGEGPSAMASDHGVAKRTGGER